MVNGSDGWWWVVLAGLFGWVATVCLLVLLVWNRRAQRRLQAEWRSQRALIAVVNRMARINSVMHLCRLILSAVNRTLGLTHSALLLWDPQQGRYALAAARPRNLLPHDLVIDRTDPLMAMIRQFRGPLRLEDLEARRLTHWASHDLDQVRSWMRTLEARLVVPIASPAQVLAVLVMGGKRAGEPYTKDDVALLAGLAKQMALGIEHARLVDALKTHDAAITELEKLASLGRLVCGMAHAIHNPLTVISGEAQLHLERFNGQDPQVDRLLQSIVEECERAGGVTRRVLRFAKPASSGFGPVDVRHVIEESLTLAGYQVHLDRFEPELTLPSDLPPVWGNASQLQQACVNMIVNACLPAPLPAPNLAGQAGNAVPAPARAIGGPAPTIPGQGSGPGRQTGQASGQPGGRLAVEAASHDGVVELQIIHINFAAPACAGLGTPACPVPDGTADRADRRNLSSGYDDRLSVVVAQRIIQAHHGSLQIRTTDEMTAFTIRLPTTRHVQPTQTPQTGLPASTPQASSVGT